ncbi:MAG: hypothetical protein GXO88_03245 [Chlorobi bacterium]|nr:hypothetical protein [Chlorobiota bacterium]
MCCYKSGSILLLKHAVLLFLSLQFVTVNVLGQKSMSADNSLLEKKQSRNFYKIQEKVYAFFDSLGIDKEGYYIKDGEKQKLYGYNQFKRWEWFWKPRVNPLTGSFPYFTAEDIRAKRSSNNSGRGFDNWTVLGPSSSSGGVYGIGRINCIAFRPGDNDVIYAGSPAGGLWKTTDGGSTWTALTDDNAVLGVSHVAVIAGSTNASDTLYIATGDRDRGALDNVDWGYTADNHSLGLLKSVNGGSSWTTTGLTFAGADGETSNRIIVNPDNHKVIYVATSDGLYKSYDAAASFAKIYSYEFVDIEMNTADTGIIYGAKRTGGQIFVSFDEGSSWTKKVDVVGGKRAELAVSQANSNRIYAVVSDNDGGLQEIQRSNDGGLSFYVVYEHPDAANPQVNLLHADCNPGAQIGGQGEYDLAIAADPTNADIVFIGGINTWKSTDGANTFSIVNHWNSDCSGSVDSVHADKHALGFQNTTSNLFEGNDGGIYKTTNGGTTWTDITNGMSIGLLYKFGVSQQNAQNVIGGFQDCGTKVLSASWSNVLLADGLDCAIDYTINNTQYGTKQGGRLYRTFDGWSSSSYLGSFGPDWFMPIHIDPNNHNTIYLGDNTVLRKSTNNGGNWTIIGSSTDIGTEYITCMDVADANSNYIYVGKSTEVYKTTDGGSNWSNVTGTLPVASANVTCLRICHESPDTVWAAMGAFNSYSAYQSFDGGTSWADISTGLPGAPVMSIVQNEQNLDTLELYAGTDVGVYQKLGSADWTLYSSGLPNVVITELEIYYNSSNPENSNLMAASWGRGVWESDLPPPAPIADFTADNTTPVIIDTVSFSDASTGVPTTWSWTISPATYKYVDGTDESSQNPHIKFTATGLYTIGLFCQNAVGGDDETKTDYINVGPLVYCSADGGTTNPAYEYISGVEIGTINNTGTGADEYTDYTALSTDIGIGESESLTVTIAHWFAGDDVGVWVDWNQDGDFSDTDEDVVCSINSNPVYTISVPTDAITGTTTMRVRMKYNGTTCASPCGHTSYGEVEDYSINVVAGSNIWTGNTSTDWAIKSNWSKGNIPVSTEAVIIPQTPAGGVFPVVNSSTLDAVCKKITLQTGASITIDGKLTVME